MKDKNGNYIRFSVKDYEHISYEQYTDALLVGGSNSYVDEWTEVFKNNSDSCVMYLAHMREVSRLSDLVSQIDCRKVDKIRERSKKIRKFDKKALQLLRRYVKGDDFDVICQAYAYVGTDHL